MAMYSKPLYLQSESYSAEDERMLMGAQMADRGGIVYPGDLLVTQKASTPNMSVDIASGRIFIPGSEGTYQRIYLAENRGVTNLPLTASDLTFARYDLIIARIRDSAYSGVVNSATLEVVEGVPASTPLEPTAPDNSVILARVHVPANLSAVLTATHILDRRIGSTKGQAAGLGGVIATTSGNRPTVNLYKGLEIVEVDTNRRLMWNGTTWIGTGSFTAPPTQYHNFGPISRDIGTGHGDALAVAAAMVAPYPVRMHIDVSGSVGFGASGVCRANIRLLNFPGTGILAPGAPYLTGGSGSGGGELIVDVGAPYVESFYMLGIHDFTAGQNCSFKLQMACVGGSNIYISGSCKLTFEPKVS